MTIIVTITNWMLARRWVQYVLLALVILLALATLALALGLKVQSSRLQAAREKTMGIEAQVELQNQGILQLQAQGEAAQRQAKAAQTEAAKITRKYEARVRALMEQPAPAGCEEARVYGFDLARKLAEGDK